MRILRFVFMAGVAVHFLAPLMAQQRSSDADEMTLLRRTDAADSAPVNSEVFRTVVIPAGKTVLLDSAFDYSAVANVAITVQCNICGSLSSSLTGSGLVLQARWTVPNADVYVAAEMKPASGFPYWDSGAALFNVYGPQFRLALQNKGSQTIALQQVTIFRRSQ